MKTSDSKQTRSLSRTEYLKTTGWLAIATGRLIYASAIPLAKGGPGKGGPGPGGPAMGGPGPGSPGMGGPPAFDKQGAAPAVTSLLMSTAPAHTDGAAGHNQTPETV